MSKRVLLCLSHSIEEYQQLKLLTAAGYEVLSIGGYINPHAPHDPKRPALPNVPHYADLQKVVDDLGTNDNLGAAQSHIPDAILEWLGDDGVIIYHHLLQRLWGQWPRLREWMYGSPERRIVWRSVGQTDPTLEMTAGYYRGQGLERVAYSPKEANIPGHAGYDALIRFYVDDDEFSNWQGDEAAVTNITQRLFYRGDATSPDFWRAATAGLPAFPLGEGTDFGILPYEDMKAALRRFRAYLYCGTRPASLTLGLLEALVTGIPVVSIGQNYWGRGIEWLPDVFEAHELAPHHSDDPQVARLFLQRLLDDWNFAREVSAVQRTKAVREFGRNRVMADWQYFLG